MSPDLLLCYISMNAAAYIRSLNFFINYVTSGKRSFFNKILLYPIRPIQSSNAWRKNFINMSTPIYNFPVPQVLTPQTISQGVYLRGIRIRIHRVMLQILSQHLYKLQTFSIIISLFSEMSFSCVQRLILHIIANDVINDVSSNLQITLKCKKCSISSMCSYLFAEPIDFQILAASCKYQGCC